MTGPAASRPNRLELEQFLAAVAHDLRAPLTAILVWEKLLRDGAADAALREQALDAIRDSALGQSRLIGDLLDVARGISGTLHIELRDGDAGRLRQVLDDLLANAGKLSPRVPSPPPGAASAPRLDRTRVLLVDDDQRVREALGFLLGRAGAVVEPAASAETARAQIAHGAPEVLVCDIAMPGEDGYSFIRRLRATGSNIAAIAVTAHATASDVQRALAAGFDRHLAKPIDFDRLVAMIGELAVERRP